MRESIQSFKVYICFSAHPLSSKALRIFVETDASDVALGAVSLQADQHSSSLFPCGYDSQKLNIAKKKYIIWDKEC